MDGRHDARFNQQQPNEHLTETVKTTFKRIQPLLAAVAALAASGGLGGAVEPEPSGEAKPADFLAQELKRRLATGPVKFRLMLQLPNPGDPTSDPSLLWPEDRKAVDAGTISIASVGADSAAAERTLAFDPTDLTEGIELSDDPLPALRSSLYAPSVKHRHHK